MLINKTLLALVSAAALAVPAAAFAQPAWDGGYRDGRDRRFEDRRFDRDRRIDDRVCRPGVFYMRGTWCAEHRGDRGRRFERGDRR
jgi:hypothetical protein